MVDSHLFRKIPSVDRLLNHEKIRSLATLYPQSLILKAIHNVLEEIREGIKRGSIDGEDLDLLRIISSIRDEADRISRPNLIPVINATGIIVHTNLGRSLLSDAVVKDFHLIASNYSNLEFDLRVGRRGSRYVHVEEILKELTGSEAAMVVNNNAAAVLLCLDTFARGRKVIVSRGELIEIGGSFRMPEVMKRGGAEMVEVGTTNKTHLKDYEDAIDEDTSIILKVHKSNYEIVGFSEEVSIEELVKLGRRYGKIVMEDLGSGCFVDFSKYGLMKEPLVQESVKAGVDIITFSGDKLLGGPQAGIILGKGELIELLRKNQLARALRIDKLTLFALERTLRLYRDEDMAIEKIPTLKMICEPYERVRRRAMRLKRRIGKLNTPNFQVQIEDVFSKTGGGALPLMDIPSVSLSLYPQRLSDTYMEEWLRSYDPPIIGRVEDRRVILDMRTVKDAQLNTLKDAILRLSLQEV